MTERERINLAMGRLHARYDAEDRRSNRTAFIVCVLLLFAAAALAVDSTVGWGAKVERIGCSGAPAKQVPGLQYRNFNKPPHSLLRPISGTWTESIRINSDTGTPYTHYAFETAGEVRIWRMDGTYFDRAVAAGHSAGDGYLDCWYTETV